MQVHCSKGAAVLKNDLAGLKKVADADPQTYERTAMEFYSRLRRCWERAVKEVLLSKALTRYSPGLHALQSWIEEVSSVLPRLRATAGFHRHLQWFGVRHVGEGG